MWRLIGGVAGEILVLAGTVPPGSAQGLLPWTDPAAVSRGVDTYGAQCASWQGIALEGQPDWRSPGPDGRLPAPPHDASGHIWHHPDALLFRITKYGSAAVVGGTGIKAPWHASATC